MWVRLVRAAAACDAAFMLVHRLLDAVFRTLDTIDAVRARVDAILGNGEARPPSQWPATIQGDVVVDAPAPAVVMQDATAVRAAYVSPPDLDAWKDESSSTPAKKAARAPKADEPEKAGKAKAPAKKKASSSAARPKREKPASKVPVPTSRKGSVDRSGKDFDSPRARAVEAFLIGQKAPILAEDADLDGKKTLARVLWAVAVAEQAGSEQGLTAADVSALLSSVAGIEVFATNVARTFRDEPELFVETTPDGRSKRYTVTAAGRERASTLATRSV
jgi:hypothetical protein